ncbi:YdeI/OmpD-associated family protein [Streptomyces cavernicola]|uniref:YdeI/OmpD-associated family protein n=1 Tax=Streptomyces cavernicola TaxID=3043613 RepID=A0ABT6SM45_9ACTN|nr:YdeI/OmpD-associated family protein [Streptomyces sp. B-S-A6]MDI3409263.1 YdeI/OmpD-associated family protein [Streptomyces sp. B-S-A6]
MTETLEFADLVGLDAWLERHHDVRAGLWVKVAKKGSGIESVTAGEVNDAALCWGWITGQRKGLDATHYLQRITPRRARSQWSQVNVRRVAELAAEGRMRGPGLAEVEAAKADGRWDAAYASQKDATVPEDLATALDADPVARRAYGKLGRTDAYLLALPLLRARTAKAREVALRRALAGLRSTHERPSSDGG